MTPQRPEQFGICSWSTHARTPAELIDRLDQLGLKKVQLALSAAHLDPQNPWANVQQQLEQKGYQIVSGMYGTVGEDYSTLESIRKTGGIVPDHTWEQNWQIIQAVAQLGKRMGLRVISAHAGFLPTDRNDPQFVKIADRVSRIVELFTGNGMTLIFETGQETADTLLQFLGEIDRRGAGAVGVNFDPANMILYNMGDPVASLKKLMPRVKQVHIKDAVRTSVPGTWGTEVAIGEGEVDWKGFLSTLAQGDFTGNLVIEREAGEDRVGDVRKAISRLSELMQQPV